MPDPSEHSRDTWEVTGGKMYHRTEKGEQVQLVEGDTFHPTLKQAKGDSLRNKARKVKDGGHSIRTTVSVDFDEDGNIVPDEPGPDTCTLDDLDMTPAARRDATEAGLTVAELEAVGATGANGYITDDVARALEVHS